MGFIKLLIIGFVVLTVIYWLVSIYSRSVRREKLEQEWASENRPGAGPDDREAFLQSGMAEYERGFRKKLIWLVYIVPIAVIVTIFIITNFN